jgi:sugar lactone lactonase YvrE
VDQLVLQAEKRYQEAVSVADLNPARSRELLGEAQGYLGDADRLLAGAVSLFPWRRSRLERGSRDELAGKLARLLAEVSRSFPVSPKLVFDLRSIAPGAAGAALSPVNEHLLVLDSGRGAVYQVDAAQETGKELAVGEELKDGRDLAGNFVLGRGGIFRIDEGAIVRVVEERGRWRRALRLARFGANLYVLDPGAGQIHKYVGIEGGFSLPQEYLQADGADLSQATEMAIDGRVWVFRENGEIVHCPLHGR